MKTHESDSFFNEYTAQDAVLRYSKATAGYGISFLLEHDYKEVYMDALGRLPDSVQKQGVRLLEFGCGAGMNLLHLASMLERLGIPVKAAIGTDFSPVLIETALREAKNYTSAEQQKRIQFCVAKNEMLLDDLCAGLGKTKAELKGTFDFIIGVNTIRYAHRAGKENECVQSLFELLMPGGVCVAIDMNNRFLFFRSAIRDRLRKPKEQYYLPSLAEYTAPFSKTGFHVIRSENFCWIPHSSGPVLCRMLKTFSPVLDIAAKSRSMRSLVVAQKPIG